MHHKLNGSSSPVLTATSFLWESEKFDPHRIETPNLIEIILGTDDYVGEATPSAEFHANPSMGGFSANG